MSVNSNAARFFVVSFKNIITFHEMLFSNDFFSFLLFGYKFALCWNRKKTKFHFLTQQKYGWEQKN